MSKDKTRLKYWYSRYDYSYTGSRAISVVEPCQTQYADLSREDAYKYFSQGLDEHVKCILAHLKPFAKNDILKKRLQKYNNKKSLQILMEIHRILDTLPKV